MKNILGRNNQKIRKVSMKTASGNKYKEKFKCDICEANFGHKCS